MYIYIYIHIYICVLKGINTYKKLMWKTYSTQARCSPDLRLHYLSGPRMRAKKDPRKLKSFVSYRFFKLIFTMLEHTALFYLLFYA